MVQMEDLMNIYLYSVLLLLLLLLKKIGNAYPLIEC